MSWCLISLPGPAEKWSQPRFPGASHQDRHAEYTGHRYAAHDPLWRFDGVLHVPGAIDVLRRCSPRTPVLLRKRKSVIVGSSCLPTIGCARKEHERLCHAPVSKVLELQREDDGSYRGVRPRNQCDRRKPLRPPIPTKEPVLAISPK